MLGIYVIMRLSPPCSSFQKFALAFNTNALVDKWLP